MSNKSKKTCPKGKFSGGRFGLFFNFQVISGGQRGVAHYDDYITSTLIIF